MLGRAPAAAPFIFGNARKDVDGGTTLAAGAEPPDRAVFGAESLGRLARL